MPIVLRYFQQDVTDGDLGAEESQPLAKYLDKRVVVVLGGPGIGKTTD